VANKEKRIAMWSGPHTISAQLLRAFENRQDTQVIDEPFFAYFLAHSDIEHPARVAILKTEVIDSVAIETALLAPLKPGKTIFYQNHMSHHLKIGMDQTWIEHMTHAFLIEDPIRTLARHDPSEGLPSISDTGLPQQMSMFDYVADKFGSPPPVIDAADLRKNPAKILNKLCNALGIAVDEAMLAWPKGNRDSDGASKRWGDSDIAETTSFEKPLGRSPRLDDELLHLADLAMPYYERLLRYRL